MGHVERKPDFVACADAEGGTGVLDPPENHKNIRFLSNSGLDPLKNYEATEPAYNVGSSSARQRNAILMAFCWWADDGQLIVEFGSSHHSSNKKQTKNVAKVGPLLTKFSGSAHDVNNKHADQPAHSQSVQYRSYRSMLFFFF